MIILGIDPGLNATGYGVITATSETLQVMAAGAIRPPARQPLAQRLSELAESLARIIETYQPSLAVLEALFVHHEYLTTAAMMAHARGVACLVCAQHGLEVVEYLPTRIKKALTGYGTASKDQVARVVDTWLGLEQMSWSSDASDALALAIAHAHISQSAFEIHGFSKPRRRHAAISLRR